MYQKAKKIFAGILLAIAAVVLVFFLYVSDYYHADVAIPAGAMSDSAVKMEQQEGRLVFYPENASAAGLIFYPGGKVEYTAYAPLMYELAERGVQCVLVEMPFHLAVLDANAAEGIAAQYSEIEHWYIGGHSLGGSMAASYAAKNADDLTGLVLLASYSTADLSNSGLQVLSIYGSEDGVLKIENYEKYRTNLPERMTEIVLEGGNHAGFGSYGTQKGDGTARLTGEEQIAQTAILIANFILGTNFVQ